MRKNTLHSGRAAARQTSEWADADGADGLHPIQRHLIVHVRDTAGVCPAHQLREVGRQRPVRPRHVQRSDVVARAHVVEGVPGHGGHACRPRGGGRRQRGHARERVAVREACGSPQRAGTVARRGARA